VIAKYQDIDNMTYHEVIIVLIHVICLAQIDWMFKWAIRVTTK